MNLLFKSAIGSLALVVMSISANQVHAQSYAHIQAQALEIQLKTDALLGQTHLYARTPDYPRLIRCIADMRSRAVRIHVLSLQHGCLIRMKQELRHLDVQFHAIHAIFDSAEVKASRGHGYIKGPTRHVKEHLLCIEDCICQIRKDIKYLTGHVVRQPYSDVTVPRYNVPNGYKPYSRSRTYKSRSYGRSGIHLDRGHYNSRSGIRFGNDRFSIRIGF